MASMDDKENSRAASLWSPPSLTERADRAAVGTPVRHALRRRAPPSRSALAGHREHRCHSDVRLEASSATSLWQRGSPANIAATTMLAKAGEGEQRCYNDVGGGERGRARRARAGEAGEA